MCSVALKSIDPKVILVPNSLAISSEVNIAAASHTSPGRFEPQPVPVSGSFHGLEPGTDHYEEFPSITPAMLADPMFGAIWNEMKGWEIGHPYDPMCGSRPLATGSHVTAIYLAICEALAAERERVFAGMTVPPAQRYEMVIPVEELMALAGRNTVLLPLLRDEVCLEAVVALRVETGVSSGKIGGEAQ
jgi:hypothetical protein